MKKFFLTAIILVSLFAGYAQSNGTNIITGKVVDSESKAPLEYATVTLFFKGESKPVNGGTTDINYLDQLYGNNYTPNSIQIFWIKLYMEIWQTRI